MRSGKQRQWRKLRGYLRWCCGAKRCRARCSPCQRGVGLKEAKYQTLGVRIIPKGIEEYRQLVAILDDKKWEYHTYQLPEERTLKVVIRGTPEGVTDEEVKEDLTAQDFHSLKTTRLTRRGEPRTPLPLAMAELPREEKSIF